MNIHTYQIFVRIRQIIQNNSTIASFTTLSTVVRMEKRGRKRWLLRSFLVKRFG